MAYVITLSACTQQTSSPVQKIPQTLITIADAREHPARHIDLGETGDSIGDILVFDQPLLDEQKNIIGNNSGNCIRNRVAHSYQCQWTLTFNSNNETTDSIQVAGREYDTGSSNISIVGGSGKYSGISGEMISTNNADGTFTQVLHYRLTIDFASARK
ncbi:MAG: dirigent protein [Gammaproteobacteria bacterium]|nr:dirigent protein [Gammaproteobacteria bacterium]